MILKLLEQHRERLRKPFGEVLSPGEAAARAMLGKDVSYEEIPYFFSDQYDVGMEYGGLATEWDEVVFRGDVDRHEFIVFCMAEGRVLAGMNVNVWDVNETIRELVGSRAAVDAEVLIDPGVALESLIDSDAVRSAR